MRIANHNGRALLLTSETEGVDVFTASSGSFGPDMASVYEKWDSFTAWAKETDIGAEPVEIDRSALGSPSPAPRQVLAIGLNYSEHAKESGFEQPDKLPPVFTKFVSSITGPDTEVVLPTDGNTDWEVELVAVIGRAASRVSEKEAWSHVAGLAVGQDISERISQLAGPAPQFGLGKSFAGFGPIGPWLVTVDEFADPNDLELGCSIDGQQVQKSSTGELIFSVPQLISKLSHTVKLMPGDVIFTGTPAGVGLGQTPERFLQHGERLVSWIEGIGELNQTFVSAATAS